MSRKLVLVCLASIMAVILVSMTYGFRRQVLHSTESPNHRYKVEIAQRRFVIERAVYLNAYRNGEPLVGRKLLYTGDFLDSDFRELYPNYAWASESILRIGRNVDDAENQFDGIRVINESPNRIAYLLIETSDNKIVLFDVEARASIDLGFPFYGWLSCQGEFAESEKRFGNAAEMLEAGKRPNQFEVRVNGEGVNIEGAQVRLKRVNCCAPDRPDFEHEWSY